MEKSESKVNQNILILVVVLFVVGLFFAFSGERNSDPHSPLENKDGSHSPASLAVTDVEGEVLFSSNGDIWEFVDEDTLLESGMSIRTGEDGKAILKTSKGGWIRLAEGTQLDVSSLAQKELLMVQHSGRSFHRVRQSTGSLYQVMAFGHTVEAMDATFDLATNASAKRINVKALQGNINVQASGKDIVTLEEATEVTIAQGSFAQANVNQDYLDSDWFMWNKEMDEKLGFETEIELKETPAATTPTPSAAAPAKTTSPPAATGGKCYPSASATVENAFNAIKVSWSKCNNDGFQFYKVVRSVTNSNPSYPGSSVVLSSSNRSNTTFLDKTVAKTKTYYYRVCAVERLSVVNCGNTVTITY